MKVKHILTIFTILGLFLAITGCQNLQTTPYTIYTSFITGESNDDLATPADQSIWPGTSWKEESLIGTTKTVTFNNKTYLCTYERSTYNFWHSYISDYYDCVGGEIFAINRDTGELVVMDIMSHEFFQLEGTLETLSNPSEYAITMATQFAKDLLPNFEEYQMHIEEVDAFGLCSYYVIFEKEVQGFKTTDYFSVRVTNKGQLAQVQLVEPGIASNFNRPISQELLEESITKKITDTFVETDYTLIEYEVKRHTLCYTPDGKPCVCSDLKIILNDNSGAEVTTSLRIVTILE